MHPTSADWVKMLPAVSKFMQDCFPDRQRVTLLLDGEKILRTPEARTAMKQHGLSVLPNWPSNSPDLNPQENIWGWALPKLRRVEKKSDSLAVFKRRAIAMCKSYTSPEKMVPSLANRIAKCLERNGGHVGK